MAAARGRGAPAASRGASTRGARQQQQQPCASWPPRLLLALVVCAGLCRAATPSASVAYQNEQVAQAERLRDGGTAEKLQALAILNRLLAEYPSSSAAAHLLGDMHALGQGLTQNGTAAAELWGRAAAAGLAPAQTALGLAHSHGLLAGIPRDPARAVLHLYFAAVSNHTAAQMALGYRALYGLGGMPASCAAAALYYQPPAAATLALAALPGAFPPIERVYLSVERESAGPGRATELLQWYEYSASTGSADAQASIGQLLAFGARGLPKDHASALRYFRTAAAGGSAEALAALGHAHANGLGVPADNATAIDLLTRAAGLGSAHAVYGLGYMHLSGYGVPADAVKAAAFFKQAAEAGSAEAHFHLGVLALGVRGGRRDFAVAAQHLNAAAQAGHIPAQFNLAMMQLRGLGVPLSCRSAVQLLKSIAERGPVPASELERAVEAHNAGRWVEALGRFVRAAEMGMEAGAANAAFMLQRGHGFQGPPAQAARAALWFHQRAADQGNVEALVAAGDAYYAGRGTPADLPAAAALYQRAALLNHGQAAFNLGHMHEHGAGLEVDFFLAKRFYDQAATSTPAAALPVALALAKLGAHLWLKEYGPGLLGAARVLRMHADLIAAGVMSVALVMLLQEWGRRRKARRRAAAAAARAAAAVRWQPRGLAPAEPAAAAPAA